MTYRTESLRRASGENFPFDSEAREYDATFSQGVIGTRLRNAVWTRLDECFQTGDRILDLGSGTGEDAIHMAKRGIDVLALDRSTEMVAVTREKAQRAPLVGTVETRQGALEDIGCLPTYPAFDGILSNFGALNCVNDLPTFSDTLATRLRPGAKAVLCVMGPLVPWEWSWFLLRGQLRSAFRRLHPGGVVWRGLRIRYPSIRRLRRSFQPHFQLRRVSAIGALVPPSYVETWAQRHPRILARLDRWERRFETTPPLPWLADHYLAEFDRQ